MYLYIHSIYFNCVFVGYRLLCLTLTFPTQDLGSCTMSFKDYLPDRLGPTTIIFNIGK